MEEQIAFPDAFLVFHVSITRYERVHGSCSSAKRFSENQIGQTGFSVGFILQEGSLITLNIPRIAVVKR